MGKIYRLKLPAPKDKIARRRQSYRGQETEAAPPPATPADRIRNVTRLQAKANGHDPVAQPRRNPSHDILAKIAIDASEPGLTDKLKGEAPDGTGIKLIDLDASTCRWPKGDPLDVDFEFCGRRSPEDMPYCAHHSRFAYQPAAERRRQQPRV
jgi:GcrA cell cycle regulator